MVRGHLTRRGLGLAAAALPLAGVARSGSGDPQVRTAHGPVRGVVRDGIATFLGISYGAAARFEPPTAPPAWRAPFTADRYGPASPQRGSEPDQSEDCLRLNVWTPGVDAARRPVLVYVHGGAYATGSGSSPLTDGTRLAARGDVVVITLNHRLGPLGYAYLDRLAPGFRHTGNLGQLDLILALEWVRAHAARFGGDPDRVTVFGQSGGGAKIATLMATPAAAGLFHRVLTMSGQQVTASGPLNATRRAEVWLDALGLTPDRAAEARTLPVQRLIAAAGATDPILGGSLYFGPVMDGLSLPRHPFWPDAPAQSAHIPMIIGNTREETLAFLGADPANQGLTWDVLPSRLTPAQMRLDVAPEAVVAWYRENHPTLTPDEVLIRATTAGRSWRAAVIEAEARAAQGVPARVYQLDWPARMPSGRTGAYHTSDIPLMFDTLSAPGSGAIGPQAQAMADLMSDLLVRHASTGSPDGPGLPAWTPYSLERRETLILDLPPRMQEDPRGDERAFFARIPYIQPGT